MREMRPLIADVNVTSRLAAAMRTPPALSLLEQQRRLVADLTVPTSFQAAIDAVATLDARSLRYTSDIGRLLEELRPYADVEPVVPDEETLASVRERVREIVSVNGERISVAIGALLQWLAADGRRIGWQRVSFILFTIVYPLVLTVYQDELKQAFHAAPRR